MFIGVKKGWRPLFYTLEDYKPPPFLVAVQSSRATLPINELKRTLRVRI
jgi:hypothetical protein